MRGEPGPFGPAGPQVARLHGQLTFHNIIVLKGFGIGQHKTWTLSMFYVDQYQNSKITIGQMVKMVLVKHFIRFIHKY